MDTPDPFFDIPKEELKAWIAKRQIEHQLEIKSTLTTQPLPAGMDEPPEWVRNAHQSLKTGVAPALYRAINHLQENPKDIYSFGLVIGTIHAFRNQATEAIKTASDDYRKSFGSPEKQVRTFINSLTPDKHLGLGKWKA